MVAARASRDGVPVRFMLLCEPVALPASPAPDAARPARMTGDGWSLSPARSCPGVSGVPWGGCGGLATAQRLRIGGSQQVAVDEAASTIEGS